MSYDAIVFDNDGVLTKPTPRQVLRDGVAAAFESFDADPTPDCIDGGVNGDTERIRRLCSTHDLDPEEFWARREACVAEAQRRALEDGTKPLYEDFDALYDLTVPLGVVSNNQHATIESIVEVFELGDLFGHVAGRDPTLDGFRRRKPETYYLEAALESLDIDSALYVGDSDVDVLAADAAGMDSAFIRRPHRLDYELPADPTYEIESLEELHSLTA